jgi:hypothetical protein
MIHYLHALPWLEITLLDSRKQYKLFKKGFNTLIKNFSLEDETWAEFSTLDVFAPCASLTTENFLN